VLEQAGQRASAPLLVGIDLGTTNIKAAVVGAGGQELACASVPTAWQVTPTGAEASATDLLDRALAAARRALQSAPSAPVAGVGVTSMAETAVWLDSQGQPTGPCIAWYDTRGEEEASGLPAELPGFSRRTGLPASPMCTLAKLRWVARRGERPARVLSVADWVVHALGGEQGFEASLASRTGALDVPRRRWWVEALEWAAVSPGAFPPLVEAGEPAGKAKGPLMAGAVLTCAGHDHLSAAVGAGATGTDQVLDSCGTAESLVRAVAPLDEEALENVVAEGLAGGWHALPSRGALLAGSPLGMLLDRVLRLLGVEGPGPLARLDERAAGTSPGRLRVVSHGFFGDPAIEGVHADVSPEALWAAALGEVGRKTELCLAAMLRVSGPASELVLSGGWARCPGVRRRKASLLPKCRWPAVEEAGARGAALFAGLAAGIFAGPADFPAPLERDGTSINISWGTEP
jgi:sugar (pentulose or hexulose) kinase